MFSDNGKTFVGASVKLNELFRFFETNSSKITEQLANDSINWHFIPARAPNFGGIWEAGVKCVKTHLKRVLGNANLTYENLSTVLIRIEAILNSRPLCPITANPDEINPITPAHFLVGKPLTILPEDNVIQIPQNKLRFYQRLQQLVQHFWAKWHKDYLSELQSRLKWKTTATRLIKIGTIVLVKEDNTPPLKWHIGQVVQLHPGQDGVLRVVSVKVNGSVVKRALSKLCVFPFEEDKVCGVSDVESMPTFQGGQNVKAIDHLNFAPCTSSSDVQPPGAGCSRQGGSQQRESRRRDVLERGSTRVHARSSASSV